MSPVNFGGSPAQVRRLWGPITDDAAEERAYTRYKGIINDTAMQSANARTAMRCSCAPAGPVTSCTAKVAPRPDLTGSNGANLEYLLANVLNPNGDVQDAYKMVLVTTRDGRTFSGNVIAETDRQLTLRVVGRDNAVISKSDIQSREATSVSMMPTGLFDSLTDREVLDLVAFLRSAAPVK